jgi:DNA-binding response OmpR family regulator
MHALTSTGRVHIIEDNPGTVAILREVLAEAGFLVESAATGKVGLSKLNQENFDLALIDLHLPDLDGMDIIRSLDHRNNVAVIIVSARGENVDRILGLELGADDYITKPFDPREVVARVRALLRRIAIVREDCQRGDGVQEYSTWKFNRTSRSVQQGAETAQELTPTEFRVLDIFCSQPNRILSRAQLLDLMHGVGGGPYDRSIDLVVMRLRRKIEHSPARPRYIRTMRNEGYMFCPSVEE